MTWNQQHHPDKHQNASIFQEYAKKLNKIIVYEEDDIDDKETLYCDECGAPVLDNTKCDNCGDVLCEDCRCFDEDIAFCHECFMERFISYEEEEWML